MSINQINTHVDMKEIGINELKGLQLDILKEFANFCERKKLRYFLGYGTLIGAARHKGYIPWDDDVDVMMPREDYNILVREFNGSVDNLVINAPEININYYAPYANVYDQRTLLIEDYLHHRNDKIGVKIDIFPVDKVPLDYNKYIIVITLSKVLNALRGAKIVRISFFSGYLRFRLLFRKIIAFFFPFSFLQKLIMKVAEYSNSNSNGKYVDCVVFPETHPTRFEKELIFPLVALPFEYYYFLVPQCYELYLNNIYGDYLKLPPEEERKAKHYFKAYWK